MGKTIVEVIGLGLAVAAVPIPMIAVILMLSSKSGARNALAFLGGWLVGIAGLGGILLAVDAAAVSQTEASDLGGYLRLVIGAALLVLGWKKWRSRPKGDEEPPMPGWMSAIEDFGAAKSFGTGLGLAAANPKNIGLIFAATATIATAGLSGNQEIATLLVFVVVSSLSVAIPVVGYLVAGSPTTPVLGRLRGWLVANASTLMSILFVVLGLVLVSDGITVVF